MLEKGRMYIPSEWTDSGTKPVDSLIPNSMVYLIPHLKNHQIILAKKVKKIDQLKEIRKTTTSTVEWSKIRKNIINY